MRHKLIMTFLMGLLILVQVISICRNGYEPNNSTIIMLAVIILLEVYGRNTINHV